MMLTLEDLKRFYPDQTILDLSDDELTAAQQHCAQVSYSNEDSCNLAYQNYLVVQVLSNYLQAQLNLDIPLNPWPSSSALPSIWDVVNGTVLEVNGVRIALLPSDAVAVDDLCVPQEWVDIPNWAAAYYLAVQIDWEQPGLRVVGYASHQQVKRQGTFEPIDRTYYLDQAELATDLDLLWMACETLPVPQPDVEPIPSLTPEQAASLLAQLQTVTHYSPRLDVDFSAWAALIANSDYRQWLYQVRSHSQQTAASADVAADPALTISRDTQAVTPILTQLGQWLTGMFEPGWEVVQDMMQNQSFITDDFMAGAIARSTQQNQDGQPPNAGSAQSVQRSRRIQLGKFAVILTVCIRSNSAEINVNDTIVSNITSDIPHLQVSVQADFAEHSPIPSSVLKLCISDQDDDLVIEESASQPGTSVAALPFVVTKDEIFGIRIVLDELCSNLYVFKA